MRQPRVSKHRILKAGHHPVPILFQVVVQQHIADGRLLEAHGGNPLAPGLMNLSHMTEALMDARRTLNPDLRNIARANGLAMPEGT